MQCCSFGSSFAKPDPSSADILRCDFATSLTPITWAIRLHLCMAPRCSRKSALPFAQGNFTVAPTTPRTQVDCHAQLRLLLQDGSCTRMEVGSGIWSSPRGAATGITIPVNPRRESVFSKGDFVRVMFGGWGCCPERLICSVIFTLAGLNYLTPFHIF